MLRRRWPAWNAWWPRLAWLVLLALLPWWLGLPLLLSLAAVALLLQHRLPAQHLALLRSALRWGLPGMLFALQRALGGDAFAWGAALLGALAGYTLVVGLEAWFDRGRARAPLATVPPEWPEPATASIEPAAQIIELEWPQWQPLGPASSDPLGGSPHWRDGTYALDDGRGVDASVTFSADGRWLGAPMRGGRGTVLWDRGRERCYRLRGWQLCGWHRNQPWLARRDGDMPQALSAVLGRDDEA